MVDHRQQAHRELGARHLRRARTWLINALLPFALLACEEKQTASEPTSYVAVADLWRTLPEGLAGQSRTPAVPTLHNAKPSYVKLLHGFRAPEGSTPMTVGSPSEVWFIDARTGKLSEELRYPRAPTLFPAANLDENALARLGPLHDKLAPAFFRGDAQVPPELEADAISYRETFPKAIQPEYIEIYKAYAADWFRWVGF